MLAGEFLSLILLSARLGFTQKLHDLSIPDVLRLAPTGLQQRSPRRHFPQAGLGAGQFALEGVDPLHQVADHPGFGIGQGLVR